MANHQIGFVYADYNWRRNITRHNHEDFEFKRVIDPCRIGDRILARLGNRSAFLQHAFGSPYFPKVDLLHLWRMISLARTPWIVSTSTGLPFGWARKHWHRGMEILAADHCRKIIATSQYSYNWQLKKAQEFGLLGDRVMEKVEVLHPPQDVLLDSWDSKPPVEEALRMVLVGADFFRKGGIEILRVTNKMLNEGAKLTLQIVSPLRLDSQSGATIHQLNEAREIIARSKGVITAKETLPNDAVIELLLDSHIGLLPSYVETYGYSILEAQACGCATVTTDIFAMPEVNSPSVGWMIRIAGDDYNYLTEEGRKRISTLIESGLYTALSEAVNDAQRLREKGEAALTRIRTDHSPANHARRLHKIYSEVVDEH